MDFSMKTVMNWSRLGSRKTFGAVLCELAPQHPELIVLTADVALSAGMSEFIQRFPEQFIDVGIAEQNMLGIAAGLASEGRTVFVVSFAPFASMRCFEMCRTSIGYMNLNVKIVGLASGLAMGVAGNTHYGLEDIALMRTIPGMTVLSPADCAETVKAMQALLDNHGPAYLRLTGTEGAPVVYKEDYEYSIGRSLCLRQGSDAALIATGTMVNEALRAARLLKKENLSATVIDMHTIKPLDTEAIDTCLDHKLIVTTEEHSVIGGLGSAVAEYLAQKAQHPRQIIVGINDCFPHAGDYSYMLNQCGLTATAIASRVISAL